MNLPRKIFHPIMALIAVQVVWITLVVFWIYWFVGKHREFRELAEKYRPELLGRGFNWPVMVEGILLLVVILVGVYVIFVYWSRQSNLYAMQRDIISQVTHELKSPLASIQLHLETIRLRRPSGDKLESFVGTMLSDTDRLHYLINNLLMAARLEQRRKPCRTAPDRCQRPAGGICGKGTGQPAPGRQHLAGGRTPTQVDGRSRRDGYRTAQPV